MDIYKYEIYVFNIKIFLKEKKSTAFLISVSNMSKGNSQLDETCPKSGKYIIYKSSDKVTTHTLLSSYYYIFCASI